MGKNRCMNRKCYLIAVHPDCLPKFPFNAVSGNCGTEFSGYQYSVSKRLSLIPKEQKTIPGKFFS